MADFTMTTSLSLQLFFRGVPGGVHLLPFA